MKTLMNLGCYKDILAKADREEKAAGESWYKEANKIVHTMAGETGTDPRVVAGIIAVLSPMVEWNLNVKAARLFIKSRGRSKGVPGFRKNLNKALRILKNQDFTCIRGPKVTEFFHTLLNPGHSVPVIDSQMTQAFYSDAIDGDQIKTVTGTRRIKVLQDAVAEIAREENKPVSEIQATIWLTWKRLKGPMADQYKLWQ